MKWYFFRHKEGCNDLNICQYMRLDYLIKLLETKKYYIKRRRTFEDANESYRNNKLAFPFQQVGNNSPQQVGSEKRIIPYSNIINCPTACWAKYEHENFLMWKSYSSEVGVCIKTTVHRFISSLDINLGINENENKVLCGSMDYKQNVVPSTIEDCQLFVKDIVYENEEEYRFYFLLATDTSIKNEEKGIYVPVDINLMIDEILLSPFISKETADRIARMIKSDYDIDVKQSSIKVKL